MDEEKLDLGNVPFAAWLEDVLPDVCRMDAKAIAIVSVNRDETIGTAYYNACAGDKGQMAWQLILDGIWDMLEVNAGRLKTMIQDAEEEDEE